MKIIKQIVSLLMCFILFSFTSIQVLASDIYSDDNSEKVIQTYAVNSLDKVYPTILHGGEFQLIDSISFTGRYLAFSIAGECTSGTATSIDILIYPKGGIYPVVFKKNIPLDSAGHSVASGLEIVPYKEYKVNYVLHVTNEGAYNTARIAVSAFSYN